MAWGICCGDGWYKILDELSAKLEPLGVVALQVKEKFGGLRFYIGPVSKEHSDEVYAAIDEASTTSTKTCERCGKPGKVRGSGWVKVLCDECDSKK
jgi:hypothetical protein